MNLKIKLSEKARKHIAKSNIDTLTIDIESFGECCIGIAEAVVTTTPPADQSDYDYYRYEQLGIFVYKPVQFVSNQVTIGVSKILFSKPRLTAGQVKLL